MLDKIFGRRRDEQNADKIDEELLSEKPLNLKEKPPAVTTFKRNAIISVTIGVALIFICSFFFGFNKNNTTKTNDQAKEKITLGGEKTQGSHLSNIPENYAQAKQAEAKAAKNQATEKPETKGSVVQPQPNYQPTQYSQIPTSGQNPQQQLPRSEFSDAQKAPIKFNIENDKQQTNSQAQTGKTN